MKSPEVKHQTPKPEETRSHRGDPALPRTRTRAPRRGAFAIAIPAFLGVSACGAGTGEAQAPQPFTPTITTAATETWATISPTLVPSTEASSPTTIVVPSETTASASPASPDTSTVDTSAVEIESGIDAILTQADVLVTQQPKGRYDELRTDRSDEGTTSRIAIIEIREVKVPGGKQAEYYRVSVTRKSADQDALPGDTASITKVEVGKYQGSNHNLDDERTTVSSTYTLERAEDGTERLVVYKRGQKPERYSSFPTEGETPLTPPTLKSMEVMIRAAATTKPHTPR